MLEYAGIGWYKLKYDIIYLNRLAWDDIGWKRLEYTGIVWNRLEYDINYCNRLEYA